MTRTKKDVEAALLKKGFQAGTGDHNYFYLQTVEGKRTQIFTKTSHGSKPKELDAYLLGQMARQCRLKSGEFLQLVDCPLDRNEYEVLLRLRGHL